MKKNILREQIPLKDRVRSLELENEQLREKVRRLEFILGKNDKPFTPNFMNKMIWK